MICLELTQLFCGIIITVLDSYCQPGQICSCFYKHTQRQDSKFSQPQHHLISTAHQRFSLRKPKGPNHRGKMSSPTKLHGYGTRQSWILHHTRPDGSLPYRLESLQIYGTHVTMPWEWLRELQWCQTSTEPCIPRCDFSSMCPAKTSYACSFARLHRTASTTSML